MVSVYCHCDCSHGFSLLRLSTLPQKLATSFHCFYAAGGRECLMRRTDATQAAAATAARGAAGRFSRRAAGATVTVQRWGLAHPLGPDKMAVMLN